MKDGQFDLSDRFSFSSAAIMDGIGGLDGFLVCILLMKHVLLARTNFGTNMCTSALCTRVLCCISSKLQ